MLCRSSRHRGSPGRWRAEISLGYGPGGKRQRRRVSGPTKAAVQDALRDLRAERAVTSCDIILGLAAWEFAGSRRWVPLARMHGCTAARFDRVQEMTPMLMMYTVAASSSTSYRTLMSPA